MGRHQVAWPARLIRRQREGSAKTITFDDFIGYKGEVIPKEAGKMRAEGKEYVVKDGV